VEIATKALRSGKNQNIAAKRADTTTTEGKRIEIEKKHIYRPRQDVDTPGIPTMNHARENLMRISPNKTSKKKRRRGNSDKDYNNHQEARSRVGRSERLPAG